MSWFVKVKEIVVGRLNQQIARKKVYEKFFVRKQETLYCTAQCKSKYIARENFNIFHIR